MKPKMKYSIAPLTLLAALGMIFADKTGFFSGAVLSACVHECGHLLAARILHIPLRSLRLDFLGAGLEIGSPLLSYGEEWLLALSGPLFSFLFSGTLAGFFFSFPFWRQTAWLSFLLGLLNLLPIRSFDGGRMLKVFLLRFCGVPIAAKLQNIISFSLLLLLWACGVYCLLKAGNGLSLFCFSMSLFSRFFDGNSGE